MNGKEKKGLRLMGKFAVVVSVPMLILVAVACFVGVNGMNGVADSITKEHLHTANYSFEHIMDALSQEDYRYEDGVLYKGEYNVTENENILDEFKENTGMDISIIIGDMRCATTMVDASGNNMKDMAISSEVYSRLQNGEVVYDDSLTIGSREYFVYYEPIQSSTGEVYGSLFVGYNTNAVSDDISGNIIGLVGALCLVTVIAIVVTLLMIRTIARELEGAVGNLEEVAGGSLKVTVADKVMKRGDEVGDVSRTVRKLVNSLKEIVKNIVSTSNELDNFSGDFRQSFDNIKESITNINVAVDEIANGATQQAGDTQRANEEVIYMGEAIDATAGNVIALTDSAQKMSDYNQSANDILKELLEISKKTNESVDEVQRQTDETNRSALEIQEATELIANIASQTNLLSLNASIEAARAGDQGRGFAVVATEIRTLADQCSESAEKIANVVNELLNNSNRSVRTMNEVMDSIGEQNKKLKNTLSMFGDLNSEIEVVGQAINQISVQVGELGDAKNEVLQLLESLSAISQENAASTEETSASMVELNDIVEGCTENTDGLIRLSEELRESTRKFDIDSIKDAINR